MWSGKLFNYILNLLNQIQQSSQLQCFLLFINILIIFSINQSVSSVNAGKLWKWSSQVSRALQFDYLVLAAVPNTKYIQFTSVLHNYKLQISPFKKQDGVSLETINHSFKLLIKFLSIRQLIFKSTTFCILFFMWWVSVLSGIWHIKMPLNESDLRQKSLRSL